MKIHTIMLFLCLSAAAIAQEYPYSPPVFQKNSLNKPWQDADQEKGVLQGVPVWKGLEQMSIEERNNSEIEVILESNASSEALRAARTIEHLWNAGDYKRALALFPFLATLANARDIMIGNQWRKPISSEYNPDWAGDVRVGNRDSIRCCAMDIQRSSGNLYVILVFQEGSNYRWSMNFSSNGGSNWSETYYWSASYPLYDASAAFAGNHCYVAYGSGSLSARLRRFHAATALSDTFPNGAANIVLFSVTSPDTVEEVSIVSNHDFYDNRLYYSSITKNGTLKLLWDDLDAINWTDVNTYITDANRGLDSSCNQNYDTYFYLMSFYDNSNYLHVYGWDGSSYADAGQDPSGADSR